MKHGRSKEIIPTSVDYAKMSVPSLVLPPVASVLGKMFFGATVQSLQPTTALSVLQEMNQTLVSSEVISLSPRAKQ